MVVLTFFELFNKTRFKTYIPSSVTSFSVHLVGGGGAGGEGRVIGEIFYSGGGGGSGFEVQSSITKPAGQIWILDIIIGKESESTLVRSTNSVVFLEARPGETGGSGENNFGGAGGRSGGDGAFSFASMPPPRGGNGADATTGDGGLGGLQPGNDNVAGLNGKYGSGGGGSSVGTSSVGKGGSGIVIITF